MEATNQEVITLESNLPRIRRCRCGVGSRARRGCRAERWQRALGTEPRLSWGLGGRVARFSPVAEEPGSD